MLDENAYLSAREERVQCDCSFEKAILGTCCNCTLAHRHYIAEREAVSCQSIPAHETCRTLHALLQHNALFVLKLTHTRQKLPHAQEIKIQCGGLLGLERVVHNLDMDPPSVRDVRSMVVKALAEFAALEALPYSEIMKSVAAFEARHRRA